MDFSEAGRRYSRRAALRIWHRTVASGAAAGLFAGGAVGSALAAAGDQSPGTGQSSGAYVPTPAPTQYVVNVRHAELNPDGAKIVRATTVDGTIPGPEIRVREGDALRVLLKNELEDQPATIHWHGLLVPAAMDGVPDVSQVPIPPGEMFVYEYPVRQSGTYWYHSHYQLEEQLGLFGAFVIEAKNEPIAYDRDYVVMLSDWLHSDPYQVIPSLRDKSRGPIRTVEEMVMAQRGSGAARGDTTRGAAMDDSMAEGEGADLSDIPYDAFLLNGRGNGDPWTCVASRGERVRLRIINSSASTFFRFMIDGHPLLVTHADGPAIRPVEVDSIPIATAECYDVVVRVADSGSFAIRAEAQDGSGRALGILHTPDVRPRADASKPNWGPRQLSYEQIVAREPTTLPDGPSRAYRLRLTGDMARYIWSIDDQVYPKAEPLLVHEGERVRVEMVNETKMWHPMHLHGHFFRLLSPGVGPDFLPLKHTVGVPPGKTVRFEFFADNPGKWFFHCHNAYHLEAGMAREWVYEV
jgi:multicopper oxidase